MTSDAWSRTVPGKNSYQVVEAGYKCNMTDISAALGIVQLAEVEARLRRREQIWNTYDRQLRELPLVLPAAPDPRCRHAYHLYSVLIDTEALKIDRGQLAAAMAAENIGTGVHYVPVHMQPYYRQRYRFHPSDFPNASLIGRRTISLPLSAEMTEGDVSDVCEALTRVLRFYAKSVGNRGKSHKARAAAG
jgi:dTDP-4-amino-4,6-dideoxygalactose transaminase